MKFYITLILVLIFSFNIVYADDADTIDELFDLYDRQDMYDNLEVYKEWFDIKRTYDGLLSEMEMVELFNDFYSLALSKQEASIQNCYDAIDVLLSDNSSIEDTFSRCIMFNPDYLINLDNQYKTNVKHIDVYLSELDMYSLPENRVFDYDELNEVSAKLLEYGDSMEEIKVINLSLLKPPINDYHISTGFGVRYSSVLNSIIHNNGVDLESDDTSVRNMITGDVISIGESPVDGRFVVIDNGSGVKTYYSNLDTIYVNVGDKVKQNFLLGSSGKRYNVNTLHFAMYFNNVPVNPEILLEIIDNASE